MAADDIVYITFDNDALGANIVGSMPTQNTTISGTIEVDYTTGQVSGSYQVQGYPGDQFVANGALQESNGNYSFTVGSGFPRLSVNWTGEQPTQANLITYQNSSTDPQYSTTDEPTPQLTSSTTAPCFATGTAIMTDRGAVAVEHLAVGDVVLTASGAHRPIRWLGHRRTDCRRNACPANVMPIRIAADALGDRRPLRDLYVSPGHAICVDVLGEVLIPAIALVNGSTICQVEVDEVTYWHVELDSHDVLLAENLPAESYLDMGNRGFFQEADVVDLAVAPDTHPALLTHADFCRPFYDAGAVVAAVKARLRSRAVAGGWTLTSDLELHLEADGRRIEPVVHDLSVRFELPGGAKNVWLVSPSARPRDTLETSDSRELGLQICGLRIDGGLGAPREIAIGDPRLCAGFHEVEEACRRWTAGRARLPAELWDGCEGGVTLHVELAGRPVPRWIAPPMAVAPTESLALRA